MGLTWADSVSRRRDRRRCRTDARIVLFVGRLEPRKGVDRLIRAMTIVEAHAPDARLVIVGDGPDRGALEALARGRGPRRDVRRPRSR